MNRQLPLKVFNFGIIFQCKSASMVALCQLHMSAVVLILFITSDRMSAFSYFMKDNYDSSELPQ